MNLKLSYILGLISSLSLVSCYPPPVPNNRNVQPTEEKDDDKPATDPTDENLDPETRRKLEEYRIKNGLDPQTGEPVGDARIDFPGDRNPVIGNKPNENKISQKIIPTTPKETTLPKLDKPKPNVPTSYPYAIPVPGKQGFVFNPYTNSKINVTDVPSGTLVTDPRNANQKFYVP